MYWEVNSDSTGTELVRADTPEAAIIKWRKWHNEELDDDVASWEPLKVEAKYEDGQVVF